MEDILCANCNLPTHSGHGDCSHCKKSLKTSMEYLRESNTRRDYDPNIDPDDYSQFR